MSLAATTTASIAVYGVVKWKKELQGKARFEAAKALMTAVYGVRNNFEVVRSGWQDISEFPEEYIKNKQPGKSEATAAADAQWYIYKNRLAPLIEAMNKLDTCLLEAEALWGKEVKEYTRKINGCYNVLVISIKQVIAEQYRGIDQSSKESSSIYHANIVAYKESTDELSSKLNEIIKYFENLTRNDLKR